MKKNKKKLAWGLQHAARQHIEGAFIFSAFYADRKPLSSNCIPATPLCALFVFVILKRYYLRRVVL